MNDKQKPQRPAFAAALAALLAASSPTLAAQPTAAHRLFGSLQSVDGASITLRLRSGRLVRVDATRAFSLKRVSEPLFFNKPTVVDGAFRADGVFDASAVKRAAPQPSSWGIDR
jgi:hypothetical protein